MVHLSHQLTVNIHTFQRDVLLFVACMQLNRLALSLYCDLQIDIHSCLTIEAAQTLKSFHLTVSLIYYFPLLTLSLSLFFFSFFLFTHLSFDHTVHWSIAMFYSFIFSSTSSLATVVLLDHLISIALGELLGETFAHHFFFFFFFLLIILSTSKETFQLFTSHIF